MRNYDYNIQPSEKAERRITNLPRTKEMKENEVKKYIIEIVGSDKPTYYTKGAGDPCRTHYPKYAQMYEYIESAHKAIKKLRSQYPERKFQVRTVLVSVEVLF